VARHGDADCEAEVFAALAEIYQIATELGVPMAIWALAWGKQQPAVTSFSVGHAAPKH